MACTARVIAFTGRSLLALGLVLCVMLVFPANAATYKWVDEEGKTHFSDSLSPEETQVRHFRLDTHGRQVQIIEGAKSPETLRREQQLQHLRAETARLLEEQRSRDSALLRTYGSEADIRLALYDQVAQLDASERILKTYLERHSDILRIQQKRAADMERQGQAVPPATQKAIEDESAQIADYKAKIDALEDKKRTIAANFNRDVERFRSLKAEDDRTRRGSLGEVYAAGAESSSMVACDTETVCSRVWTLGRAYVLGKADTSVEVDNGRLVYTATPLSDQDIALTLVRIAGPEEETIFLDIRCRQSGLGLELCAGSRVRDIRAGFEASIEAGLNTAP